MTQESGRERTWIDSWASTNDDPTYPMGDFLAGGPLESPFGFSYATPEPGEPRLFYPHSWKSIPRSFKPYRPTDANNMGVRTLFNIFS